MCFSICMWRGLSYFPELQNCPDSVYGGIWRPYTRFTPHEFHEAWTRYRLESISFVFSFLSPRTILTLLLKSTQKTSPGSARDNVWESSLWLVSNLLSALILKSGTSASLFNGPLMEWWAWLLWKPMRSHSSSAPIPFSMTYERTEGLLLQGKPWMIVFWRSLLENEAAAMVTTLTPTFGGPSNLLGFEDHRECDYTIHIHSLFLFLGCLHEDHLKISVEWCLQSFNILSARW